MLKGPATNLAFLTGVLNSDGDGDRDFTPEGRRRAVENGVRKYRGESTRLVTLVQSTEYLVPSTYLVYPRYVLVDC